MANGISRKLLFLASLGVIFASATGCAEAPKVSPINPEGSPVSVQETPTAVFLPAQSSVFGVDCAHPRFADSLVYCENGGEDGDPITISIAPAYDVGDGFSMPLYNSAGAKSTGLSDFCASNGVSIDAIRAEAQTDASKTERVSAAFEALSGKFSGTLPNYPTISIGGQSQSACASYNTATGVMDLYNGCNAMSPLIEHETAHAFVGFPKVRTQLYGLEAVATLFYQNLDFFNSASSAGKAQEPEAREAISNACMYGDILSGWFENAPLQIQVDLAGGSTGVAVQYQDIIPLKAIEYARQNNGSYQAGPSEFQVFTPNLLKFRGEISP